MKKSILMVTVMAGLTGSAFAADTSATIGLRQNATPLGVTPRVGVVEATATSGAATAGAFTYDLSVPQGKTAKCVTVVRDVSGSLKLSGVNVSGSTITVSNSVAASGTVATGDKATTVCVYAD